MIFFVLVKARGFDWVAADTGICLFVVFVQGGCKYATL